jgi:hypothetical protein
MTYQTCPGCAGNGVQERNDGVLIVCPICYGCGFWYKPSPSSPFFDDGPPWQPDKYVVTCQQPTGEEFTSRAEVKYAATIGGIS